MWMHKHGRGLEAGGWQEESKRHQDAAICSVRYAMLCNSHPSHFPTCAWEYTLVAFSGKRIVCSVLSIWILFKWESNGPDCSKNTPEVLTETSPARMVSVSTLWWVCRNVSFVKLWSILNSTRQYITHPWFYLHGQCPYGDTDLDALFSGDNLNV